MTRSRISAQALFVNVIAVARDGRPVDTTAMRWVMTRVFPLPAPARMSRRPLEVRGGFSLGGVQLVQQGVVGVGGRLNRILASHGMPVQTFNPVVSEAA
ncbi:MAG: hypothetical protein R3E66_20945 [bacterium]